MVRHVSRKQLNLLYCVLVSFALATFPNHPHRDSRHVNPTRSRTPPLQVQDHSHALWSRRRVGSVLRGRRSKAPVEAWPVRPLVMEQGRNAGSLRAVPREAHEGWHHGPLVYK